MILDIDAHRTSAADILPQPSVSRAELAFGRKKLLLTSFTAAHRRNFADVRLGS
jgi:hypothetical protein